MKDIRCRGCTILKGNFRCVLKEVIIRWPEIKIKCPCFECLVKVTCMEQCHERIKYFSDNAERIPDRVDCIQRMFSERITMIPCYDCLLVPICRSKRYMKLIGECSILHKVLYRRSWGYLIRREEFPYLLIQIDCLFKTKVSKTLLTVIDIKEASKQFYEVREHQKRMKGK